MPFQKNNKLGKGRPRGSQNAMTKEMFEDLLKAMKTVKKNEAISKGKDILIHFIERAYENDTVLCTLMKKLVADQQTTKVELETDEVIVIGMDEPTEEQIAETIKKAEEIRRKATEEAMKRNEE